MADITPDTSGADWPGASRFNFMLDGSSATQVSQTEKSSLATTLRTFYFSGATTNQVWAEPRGVLACAWQGNTVTDIAAAGLMQSGVRFVNGGATSGWLHVLMRGTEGFPSSGTTVSPVTKGTAGWLQPGFIYRNQRSAAPNTLTAGKITSTANLKLQFFPFSGTVGVGDRWKATTSRLCPGIVAVAWQGDGEAAARRCATTLDASGDVIFNMGAGSGVGWLWVWRRA